MVCPATKSWPRPKRGLPGRLLPDEQDPALVEAQIGLLASL